MGQRGAAQVLAIVGRVLVGAGVVILLFAAYQLWGTGLAEARAQDRLSNQFDDRLAALGPEAVEALQQATTSSSAAPVGTPDSAVPETTTTLPAELINLLYPEEGEPVARIVIPRIGVDKVVVEGIDVADLRKGPGHFPDSPLPGQAGNAAIAGHRTTYGAPFGDIDQLAVGDEIRVSTVLGESLYRVAGWRIVQPEQVEVVADYGDNRLTLTACHPKYSAAERIVVWADLVGEPDPTVARPDAQRTIDVTPTTPLPATIVPTLPAETTGPTAVGSSMSPNDSTPNDSTPNDDTPNDSTPNDGVAAAGAASDPDGGGTAAVDPAAGHLAGDASGWPAALAWALATLAAGAAAWYLAFRLDRARGRRAARRWAIYAAASPVVGVLLFLCFTQVDRLLPAY